jgi:hypothetical protein
LIISYPLKISKIKKFEVFLQKNSSQGLGLYQTWYLKKQIWWKFGSKFLRVQVRSTKKCFEVILMGYNTVEQLHF